MKNKEVVIVFRNPHSSQLYSTHHIIEALSENQKGRRGRILL